MNIIDFRKLIEQNFDLSHLNIDNTMDKFKKYFDFLKSENMKYNLTRLDSEGLFWDQYLYQSIICYRQVDFKQINSLLDVGSGSGVPGIVLKILWPNIKLTIIESNNKKVEFLNQLVNLLQLNNVDIICGRAEQIIKHNDKKYDIVTARAVGAVKILLELLTPYAKIDGQIILPKSSSYKQEIEDIDYQLKKLKIELKEIDEFKSEGFSHCVLYFHKKEKTPDQYPRDYRDILKGFR